MPKWINLPGDKIFAQPLQQEFLRVRKLRQCRKCGQETVAPEVNCPTCDVKCARMFDRLTIIAGRRFGKSLFGSIAGVEEACIPNTIGWACAPTNPKLHRYVIPAFQKLIPTEWVESWNSEFLDLRLKNKSLIHFQTLEDPDQGRGQGLDWLWIDEVCELTQKHWDVIRPSLIDRQGVAFFTTSPRSFDWVYDNLYKPAEDGVAGYWAAHAKTSDNPVISEEYLAREKAHLSESMYRQEYEADFVIFTGAVYGGEIDAQILRTQESIQQIIPEWPQIAPWRQVLVGLDTGADHPFGAVKLISTEKGMVVVGEYLQRDKSFIEHAGNLLRLASGSDHQVKWGINRNERQGMLELGQHGIIPQPSENDVVAGTERVKSWLHTKQLWFVEEKCPITIKQMKAYRWAENTSPKDGSKRVEKVYKFNDELPDCIRYALMTWPVLPKIIVPDHTGRDISGLPEKMQQDIAAMRRIDKIDTIKANDVVGDFYL